MPIPNCFFSGFASSISFPILLVPVSPDASFSANSDVSRLAIDNGGLADAVGDSSFADALGVKAELFDACSLLCRAEA